MLANVSKLNKATYFRKQPFTIDGYPYQLVDISSRTVNPIGICDVENEITGSSIQICFPNSWFQREFTIDLCFNSEAQLFEFTKRLSVGQHVLKGQVFEEPMTVTMRPTNETPKGCKGKWIATFRCKQTRKCGADDCNDDIQYSVAG